MEELQQFFYNKFTKFELIWTVIAFTAIHAFVIITTLSLQLTKIFYSENKIITYFLKKRIKKIIIKNINEQNLLFRFYTKLTSRETDQILFLSLFFTIPPLLHFFQSTKILLILASPFFPHY